MKVWHSLQDQPPQAFYGVFDGHAGTDAATYAAKHIHVNLVRSCGLENDLMEACKSAFKVTDDLFIPKAKKEVGYWYVHSFVKSKLLEG